MILLIVGCGRSGSSNSTPSVAVTKSAIYTFQSDSIPAHDLGSLSDINLRCANSFSTYNPVISCTKFLGLVGHSSTTGIKTFASYHVLDGARPVKLIDGTTISSSFSDFLTNAPPAMNGATWAGWPSSTWFSGISSDGSVGGNCNDYSDANEWITLGSNNVSGNWDVDQDPCSYYDDYRHLCICY